MTEYNIKVIKQNRILLSILIVAIGLPFCLFLSTKLETDFIKIAFLLLTIVILSILLYYFSFGQLKITLLENQLNFKWKQKPIFNFKNYNSIKINEITSIIVEQGIHIKKLKTKDSEIELGGLKNQNVDSKKLLKLLRKRTDVKPKDSWDVWQEQGWLKTAFRINLSILVCSILIVIIYIVLKGFNLKLLLIMPLILSQLVFYHLHMKSKM